MNLDAVTFLLIAALVVGGLALYGRRCQMRNGAAARARAIAADEVAEAEVSAEPASTLAEFTPEALETVALGAA